MTHFKFDWKKTNLLVNPTIQMVAPAPEEEVLAEETTPQETEDSGSSESYEASPDDVPASTGDIEVAIRVTCTWKVFPMQ